MMGLGFIILLVLCVLVTTVSFPIFYAIFWAIYKYFLKVKKSFWVKAFWSLGFSIFMPILLAFMIEATAAYCNGFCQLLLMATLTPLILLMIIALILALGFWIKKIRFGHQS